MPSCLQSYTRVCVCVFTGPHDENFDHTLSIPHSVDSPISITEEALPSGAGGGGAFGVGVEGGEGEKKPGLDELLSKEAVKIDCSLDQIFEDSEEEEDGSLVSQGEANRVGRRELELHVTEY